MSGDKMEKSFKGGVFAIPKDPRFGRIYEIPCG
jgi:hypothetical protein